MSRFDGTIGYKSFMETGLGEGVVRLVILGGPGAGKGTQAELLCRHFSIPWIATGEILREAIAQKTELGGKAQPFVEKGELVPDPTMIEFIQSRLVLPNASKGWLLDGYPRTAFQAEELDFLLEDLQQRLDWAIWIDVPDAVLTSRSLARSRQDDRPEIVQRRIEQFRDCTIPILEYYERRHRLITIKGDRSPEEVSQEIQAKL